METATALQKYNAAVRQRNAALALVALLVIPIVALSVVLVNKQDRVILIPSTLPETLAMTAGAVDPAYLEALARDAAFALLNMTPAATDATRAALLRIVAPDAYGDLGAEWDRVLTDMRARDVSTAFFITQAASSPAEMMVEIKGRLNTYLGGEQVNSETKIYRFRFRATRMGVRLQSITELEDPDA